MAKPAVFAKLICNELAKIGLGISLTTLFIIGLNFEGDWMKSLADPKKCITEAVEKAARDSVGKSFNLADAFKPDKTFALAMIFGGFGTVIRELGVPFYTSSELYEKFCEWIKNINHDAGETLHKILSFQIPFINQSVFDLILGLLLGGPVEVIGDTVMGIIMNFLMEIINNVTTQMLATIVEYIVKTTVS